MKDEVIESLHRMTDIEFIKSHYQYFINNTRQTKEKAIPTILIEIERKFQFNLERMKKELDSLFLLTAPIVHQKICSELKLDFGTLKRELSKKNIIKRIEESNEKKRNRSILISGDFDNSYLTRIAKDKIDLAILKTPYLDDYLDDINLFIKSFEAAILRFEQGSQKDEVAKQQPIIKTLVFDRNSSNYFIADSKRFISICNEYSKKPINLNGNNVPVIDCENEGLDKFIWVGSGDNKIPPLAQFISRLLVLKVVRNRKKAPIAKFFLHFFQLIEEYPNPHYLSTLITLPGEVSEKENLFFAIK